jgi:hypothetical protein
MATVLLLLLVSSGDRRVDTEILVTRHEESLRKIYSIRAKINWNASENDGKTWKLVYSYQIERSGQTERVHQAMSHAMLDGQLRSARQFNDWLSTPTGQWTLQGLDPEHPPKEPLSLLEEQELRTKISGRMRAAQPFGPLGYKTGWEYPILMPAPLDTLRELCKANGSERPIEGRNEQGDPVWNLDLKVPGNAMACKVSLIPKYGYMIYLSEFTVGKAVQKLTVAEFQEVKPGIFFPKLLRGTVKNPNQLLEVTVSDLDVNTPIPEDHFTLRFPAGISVADEMNDCFYVWGDGKPAVTLKTGAELSKWRQAKLREELKTARASGSWSLLMVLCASLVWAALIVLKRRWKAVKLAA